MLRGWRGVVCVSTLAILGTLAVYGRTVSYGFSYDDYHFVRPYSSAELLGTWSGSWDPTGIESPFYRPLTTAFIALRFEAFGINAAAYRWLTLVMFALAAALCGLLVARVTGSTWTASLATVWFCAHPSFAYSLAGWAMHQMHLAEMILVLGALLWWWHCKSRPVLWWSPLLLLQAAVMLVKEDGAMLLPAIWGVHLLYRFMVDRDVPYPPLAFVTAGIALSVGLFVLRRESLGGLGGYGVPEWDGMARNFTVGLERVFFQVPARRPWQPFVSRAVVVLPLLAAWPLTRALNRRFAFLGAAGLSMAVLFNVPFVFVSKPEQYHLVALGACLLLIASAGALAGLAPSRAARVCVQGAAFVLTVALARVAVHAVSDFAPCSARTLSTNAIVRGWGAVPAEIRESLPTESQACNPESANPADLPVVVFGAWGVEDDNGVPARWTSGRVTILARRGTTSVFVPLRAVLGPMGGNPARVGAVANGRLLWELELHDERWRCAQVPLRPHPGSWLTRSNRAELRVSPTWIPARVLRGSSDTRELGIRLGTVGDACPG